MILCAECCKPDDNMLMAFARQTRNGDPVHPRRPVCEPCFREGPKRNRHGVLVDYGPKIAAWYQTFFELVEMPSPIPDDVMKWDDGRPVRQYADDGSRFLHRDDGVPDDPIEECNGEHDDGIADGNLTACSPTSGCGLPGCSYRGP